MEAWTDGRFCGRREEGGGRVREDVVEIWTGLRQRVIR